MVRPPDPPGAGPRAGRRGGGGDRDGDVPDGRQLRRRQNRDAVVDALLDLYHDGNLHPSAGEIAARAGVSPRSLFRYFDDIDDLTRTAVQHQQQRAQDLAPLAVGRDEPLDVKVDALLDQRFRIYEAVGNAAVVARVRAPLQPPMADHVRRNRALLRGQVEALFAPELAALPADRAAGASAAADLLTTFEAFQHLTGDQGLGRARAVVGNALHVLLTSTPCPGA